MLTLTKLKEKLSEQCGYLDSFIYQDRRIIITDDFSLIVDDKTVNIEFKSLEEAREYAKLYVNNQNIIEDINKVIPEEKIVNLIEKYHSIKITDTVVESYMNLASSNVFTIDPVLLEIKQNDSCLPGKIEHKLNDGYTIAISEDTQRLLNRLLEDKYQIIEYMRESRENFMRIIKEVI